MKGLTLDAGALIGLERNDRRILALIQGVLARKLALAIPAGVLGQVWRDGRKQVRLARLVSRAEVDIVPLDDAAARAAGQLCGVRGRDDVIDASVVLCARARDHRIVTSDPKDLEALDPSAELIIV